MQLISINRQHYSCRCKRPWQYWRSYCKEIPSYGLDKMPMSVDQE